MASIQQQPLSRRSTSQSNEPVPSSQHHSSHGTEAEQEQEQEQTAEVQQEEVLPHTTAAPEEEDPSVKKCWICFSDSTEDTTAASPWRDPCPCALVAHEQCLLDWIADTETSKSGLSKGQILCPQCKSEIELARPRDYIVDTVRFMQTLTNRAVLPAAAVTLSVNLLHKLSFLYGVHTIHRIFSTQDAKRILQPVVQYALRPPLDLDSSVTELRAETLANITHLAKHWRLYLGLPLITPALLLSRTNWHVSQAFLTVVPTIFFALQPHTDNFYPVLQYPPSASMAFALLPYVRSAYFLYYEKVWGEKERRWRREILPPTKQSENEDPAERIEEAVNGNVFEIRVDGGGGMWEDDAGAEERAPADEAAPAPVVPDNRAQAGNGQANRDEDAQPANFRRRIPFSPTSIAESILGALAFPSIAEMSGEVLKLALPLSWTTTEAVLEKTSSSQFSWITSIALLASNKPVVRKGLLHEKWGRSLIGGCLFVVIKDAIMLYVRWRMAQMHRNRHVLDYAGPRVRNG